MSLKAENLKAREQKIVKFAVFCACLCICLLFWSYWAWVRIPALHARHELAQANAAKVFLTDMKEADRIAGHIETIPNVTQASLLEFHTWISGLKSVHPQPAYQAVLATFQKRIDQWEAARAKDTTVTKLKQELVEIKAENKKLTASSELLRQTLEEKKSQKQPF